MTRARLPVAAVLGAATLWLVGCVQTTDDVVVKADGSGSFTEAMVVDLEAMAQLQEAMKAFGPPNAGPGHVPGMEGGERPSDAPPPTEPGKPPEPGAAPPAADGAPKPPSDPLERLKARWKDVAGLEVTKAASETKDGKSVLSIEAKFATLEAYAQATGIEMGSSLVKNEDGSYTLRFEMRGGRGGRAGGGRGGPGMGETPPGGTDGGTGGGMEGGDGAGMEPPPPGMEGGGAPRGGGFGGMGGMMPPEVEKWMAGMEFKRTLKLPGTIVETNGAKGEDGATVSWKLTYDDLKGGKAEAQTVTFKGDGLDLKPFSVKRSARRALMGGPPGGPGGPGAPGAPPGPGAAGGDGK